MSGGCHVMDLGWCVYCDGLGVSRWYVHVMDWRWRQKMMV